MGAQRSWPDPRFSAFQSRSTALPPPAVDRLSSQLHLDTPNVSVNNRRPRRRDQWAACNRLRPTSLEAPHPSGKGASVPDHESEFANDALERLEWADAKEGEDGPQSRLRAMTRRTALTGAGAGLATAVIAACGGSSSPSTTKAQTSQSSGTPASGIFKTSGKMKFVFVNHVTTNPFFVPTKYGAEDACKLLGCSYQWTGSET